MFHRIGAAALKPDLTNTLLLCEQLGNPHTKFKTIHVAGTNGKGSTSHMLASILQSAGYKTGLYTSPHLKEFTERIRLNGDEIEKDFVVDFVNRIQPLIDTIKPSFFEITVALAFDYFAQQGVDVAVIEVGLGGRLDSTNILTPELSVITNIGWDHSDLLGNTLELIASEKAGIIKKNVPVVVSQRQPGIDKVFLEKAATTNSPLWFASDEYTIEAKQNVDGSILLDVANNDGKVFKDLHLPLQGLYQQKNLPGVLKSVNLLRETGFQISHDSLLHGLTHVIEQTGLKGRWQKLGENPLIICDTGHNEDGIREIVRQIKMQKFKTLWMIIGMVKDKDITGILKLLPRDANYYFCQANIPRALEATALAEQAAKVRLRGNVVADVNEALEKVKEHAATDDMIFIGGSTFVVGDLKML